MKWQHVVAGGAVSGLIIALVERKYPGLQSGWRFLIIFLTWMATVRALHWVGPWKDK